VPVVGKRSSGEVAASPHDSSHIALHAALARRDTEHVLTWGNGHLSLGELPLRLELGR